MLKNPLLWANYTHDNAQKPINLNHLQCPTKPTKYILYNKQKPNISILYSKTNYKAQQKPIVVANQARKPL